MAYSVGGAGQRVSIRVYDLSGRMVRSLVNDFQVAGHHRCEWDGRDESGQQSRSGMYFIRVRVENEMRSVRVMFLQ